MKTVIEPKFRCGECHELHDDEDEARFCCVPSVVEVYICPICHTEYDHDEEAAIECCGFDPDGPPPPPTAAELEAAGQERLF
ncbi:hypothetical protein [Sulfuriferula sp. AH1]|uniref:hypothetical protein n=1 Tax=Sulfuriferula sp. AH1 TaxID=1985873 RepID=UPI0012FA908E|nr:hypothetical protein [Sulfuriferula sp. AH1]